MEHILVLMIEKLCHLSAEHPLEQNLLYNYHLYVLLTFKSVNNDESKPT